MQKKPRKTSKKSLPPYDWRRQLGVGVLIAIVKGAIEWLIQHH